MAEHGKQKQRKAQACLSAQREFACALLLLRSAGDPVGAMHLELQVLGTKAKTKSHSLRRAKQGVIYHYSQ